MIHFVVICLYQASLIAGSSYLSVPRNPFYVNKGDNVQLKWTFPLESLLLARWGSVNSDNILHKIYLSKTGNNPVKLYPSQSPGILYRDQSMIIENVQLKDSGVYRCSVNYIGVEEDLYNDTRVIVIDLSAIPPSQTSYDVYETQELTINLDITGSPAPVVKWYRQNILLANQNEATITIIKDDGDNSVYRLSLYISSISYTEHDGEYEIKLEFPGVNQKSLQKFQVNVKYSPGETTIFTANKDTPIIPTGQSVSLFCSAQSYPTPVYTIFKNKDVISNQSRYEIQFMSFSYEANYSCIPKNEIGEGVKKTIEIVNGVPPSFTSPNHSVSVSSGETAKSAFTVKGKPKPNISLLFNGKKPNRVFDIQETSSIDGEGVTRVFVILTVNNTQLDDQGIFSCVATNQVGHSTSTLDLNVLYALQFKPNVNKDQIDGVVSQTNVIPCEAIVNPGKITYSWRFENSVFTSHVNQSEGNLTFSSLAPTHEGTYECVAKSGADEISHKTFLSVSEKPVIKNLTNNKTIEFESYLDLYCHATGSPSPSYRWLVQGTDIILKDGNTFRFFALSEDIGVNKFVCEAYNRAGNDQKTMEVTVINSRGKVKDDLAYWLVPLLIGITLSILLILFACFVRKKILRNYQKSKKSSPIQLPKEINSTPTSDNKELRQTRRTEKLTLNPMYLENEDTVDTLHPVYLPNNFETSNMQIMSIQRFQGETLLWPGDEEGEKEEMTIEMKFEDENENYETQSYKHVSAEVNSAFEDDEFSTVSIEGDVNNSNIETDSITIEEANKNEEDGYSLKRQQGVRNGDILNDIEENVDQYVDDLFDFR